MTSKSQETKEKKTDKLNFIKMKNICASKSTITWMRRKPTKWQKTLANHLSDKGLISRICTELQFNDKKTQKNKKTKNPQIIQLKN